MRRRPAQWSIAVRRALVTLCVSLLITLGCASGAAAEPVPSPGADQLAYDKLSEEVRKLKLDNDRADSGLGLALAAAPFITVLVAAVTFGAAALKQYRDNEAQRAADRSQQQKDRQQRTDQRERELQQRFDEQFTAAIVNVGSTEAGLQVAGAASLLRLQDSANASLQREILLYCAAQLRIGDNPRVQQVIKEIFLNALRLITSPDSGVILTELNLRGADLAGADLKGIDLRQLRLDLTGADLTGAILHSADLWRVQAARAVFAGADCRGVNFGPAMLRGADFRRAQLSGARLSSANVRAANLSGAVLRGAKLSSVHFENCIMNPTFFDHADINDAYFTGAKLDDVTLASLVTAQHRDTAHGLPPLAPVA